jgi:hypothetical protein
MAVGVSHVHLANIPRHVGRRPDDFQILLHAMPMYGVDVFDPDRHPHTRIRRVGAIESDNRRKWALASAALTVVAEKNLAMAGKYTAKRWRLTPFPTLLPSKLLEPGKALLHVRDIQDRCEPFRVHARHPPNALNLITAGYGR